LCPCHRQMSIDGYALRRVLQQIAFGYVLTPSGRMRKMYNYAMISLAREGCDRLGIADSNGACEPSNTTFELSLVSLLVTALDAARSFFQVRRTVTLAHSLRLSNTWPGAKPVAAL
jgi:hypothetical protein